MKSKSIVLALFWVFITSGCKKADEYVTEKIREERVKLANRGVLPATWTEKRVDQFYIDNKGKSRDQIIKLLGEPRYQWEDAETSTMKYVLDGTVGNPKITIEFSGFSLKFKDERLMNISKIYGGQY